LSVFISEEKVKKFIKEAVNNDVMVREISEEMKKAVSSYIVSQIKALSHKDEVRLPVSWSNSTLIKRAYELTEYIGLLTIANRPENKDDFTENYLDFSTHFQIGNIVRNGNVFIQYVHAVKLFRQIRDLNEMGKLRHLSNVENNSRMAKLKQCYGAMEVVVECLARTKNKENAFWVTTLLSITIHAMASVHYIHENEDLYDLEKSRELLMVVDYLCTEGNGFLKTTEQPLIDFYTLNGSLILTLPYKSFDQQHDDIMSLTIWPSVQQFDI